MDTLISYLYCMLAFFFTFVTLFFVIILDNTGSLCTNLFQYYQLLIYLNEIPKRARLYGMYIIGNRGWDKRMKLISFVEWLNRSEREKTWFLLIPIPVLSTVVAGFYNCKLPLNVSIIHSNICFSCARMTESKINLVSWRREEFHAQNVFYKSVSATPFLPASFLYEPRRQNHDLIQFGDTIILQAYTLK